MICVALVYGVCECACVVGVGLDLLGGDDGSKVDVCACDVGCVVLVCVRGCVVGRTFSVDGLPSMCKNTRKQGPAWHTFLEEQTKGKLKAN